jgi:hypothetical protein
MYPERKLISRRRLRERDGNVSLMTIYRRERTVPHYPKPVLIRNRAFYFEDDVAAYFRSLREPSQSPAAE